MKNGDYGRSPIDPLEPKCNIHQHAHERIECCPDSLTAELRADGGTNSIHAPDGEWSGSGVSRAECIIELTDHRLAVRVEIFLALLLKADFDVIQGIGVQLGANGFNRAVGQACIREPLTDLINGGFRGEADVYERAAA